MSKDCGLWLLGFPLIALPLRLLFLSHPAETRGLLLLPPDLLPHPADTRGLLLLPLDLLVDVGNSETNLEKQN